MGKFEKIPAKASGDMLDSAAIASMIDEAIASGFEPWDGVESIIAEGRKAKGLTHE